MYESHELTLSEDRKRLLSLKKGGRITLRDTGAAVGAGDSEFCSQCFLCRAHSCFHNGLQAPRFYDIIAAGKLYVSEPVCLKDVPWLRAVRVHPETGGPPVSGKETKNAQKVPSLAV